MTLNTLTFGDNLYAEKFFVGVLEGFFLKHDAAQELWQPVQFVTSHGLQMFADQRQQQEEVGMRGLCFIVSLEIQTDG